MLSSIFCYRVEWWVWPPSLFGLFVYNFVTDVVYYCMVNFTTVHNSNVQPDTTRCHTGPSFVNRTFRCFKSFLPFLFKAAAKTVLCLPCFYDSTPQAVVWAFIYLILIPNHMSWWSSLLSQGFHDITKSHLPLEFQDSACKIWAHSGIIISARQKPARSQDIRDGTNAANPKADQPD